MRLRGVGIDLGLSSGSAVLLEADPQNTTILRIETLAVWRRKRANRISSTELYVNTKSKPEDVARFFLNKSSQFGQDSFAPGVPVGIDWDPTEVFWGTSRPGAVLKAFAAGIIYRDILVYGSIPVFLPPSYVRDSLGLSGKIEKEKVWSRFLSRVSFNGALTTKEWERMSEHEKDAIILGYLAISAFSKHLSEDADGRSPISTISLPRN